MNLYKFNFDLAGSSNTFKAVTIPTDSKYSVGVKFFKGNEELVIGDDVTVTIQDDKYIYTPTEIFNNYAVFASATGPKSESKTYKVNFHKDGKDPIWVKDQTNVSPQTTRATVYFTLQNILDAGITNFEDFDYYKFRWLAYCDQNSEKNHDLNEYKYLTDGTSTKYIVTDVYKNTFPTNSMRFGADGKRIYLFKINDKIGFIPFETAEAKIGQKPSESDFLTGPIMDWFVTMPGTSYARAGLASVQMVKDEYVHNYVSYGDRIPEVNQSFNGITVKTNDSNVSNWAITDSQMKIVYTDEWPELSATADDRLIYFVVDKPTPPQPVPPKPTPSGEGEYFNFYMTVKNDDPEFDDFTEDAEYNPNDYNPNYLNERGVKATYRGKTVYLDQVYNSSSQAEIVEVEGTRYKKIDQRAIMLDIADWDPEDYHLSMQGVMIEDGKLYSIQLDKKFNSEEEMDKYYNNYISVFGEDGDTPGDAGIPANLDDFEIPEGAKFAFEDVLDNVISKVDTDKYYWLYGSGNVEPELNSEVKLKLWKVDTYPQWQPEIF